MKMFFAILILFLFGFNSMAEYRFPIGERAIYKIKWGPLFCGTSSISCDKVTLEGRELIRIRICAKSNKLVSTVYSVNDTVDCYIDPQTQQSIRLEKHTTEGGHTDKDVLTFDRKMKIAHWVSTSANITTNYSVTADACDAVSFLYAFRNDEFEENTAKDYSIVVDAAQQGLSITATKTAKKRVGNKRKQLCREYVVTPKKKGLFVRKVPQSIWITEDKRKIMTRMDVKFPLGSAHIVLDEYIPPKITTVAKADQDDPLD